MGTPGAGTPIGGIGTPVGGGVHTWGPKSVGVLQDHDDRSDLKSLTSKAGRWHCNSGWSAPKHATSMTEIVNCIKARWYCDTSGWYRYASRWYCCWAAKACARDSELLSMVLV